MCCANAPCLVPPRMAHFDKLRTLALTALRVFAGLSFSLAHGYPKVFEGKIQGLTARVTDWGWPFPALFAWSAGLAELLGGLALALGVLVRPLAPFAMGTMLVAAFVAHADDPWSKKEFALLYFFVFLFFFANGPGPLSLEAWLRRRRVM